MILSCYGFQTADTGVMALSPVLQHKGLGDPEHSREVGSQSQSNHRCWYDLQRWLVKVVMGQLNGSLQQKQMAPSAQNTDSCSAGVESGEYQVREEWSGMVLF
jgi:hypothetical protein